MGLGGIDLNLLVALKALLEEANVTHAGRRLSMSQPAMSGALARLRRHFDDELLVRNGRDYELTPLAFDLLPAVQRALRLLEQALQVGDGFDPSVSTRTFRVMLSDYAMAILHPLLSARLRSRAPHVRLELSDLDADIRGSNRPIVDNDVLVGPLGFGFPGESRLLFRDRMVCLLDRRNPRLVDGRIDLADLAALPHAIATFRGTNLTPADRVLGELGIDRRVQVAVGGWLPLPFVIEGTDMVAVVPERLARQFCGGNLQWVQPPFGEVDLVEGLWYQPTAADDPAIGWLLSLLDDIGAELKHTERGVPA